MILPVFDETPIESIENIPPVEYIKYDPVDKDKFNLPFWSSVSELVNCKSLGNPLNPEKFVCQIKINLDPKELPQW